MNNLEYENFCVGENFTKDFNLVFNDKTPLNAIVLLKEHVLNLLNETENYLENSKKENSNNITEFELNKITNWGYTFSMNDREETTFWERLKYDELIFEKGIEYVIKDITEENFNKYGFEYEIKELELEKMEIIQFYYSESYPYRECEINVKKLKDI